MNNPMMNKIRKEYLRQELEESSTPENPLELFRQWFETAVAADIIEPNAMALATATPDGQPSVRVVLLKEFDGHGFIFFTNYLSRKGLEIAANPHAAATFWWAELEQQVRIEGKIEKLAPAESDAYFDTRPRGSQLGAWASPQSQPVADRAALEHNLAEVAAHYGDGAPITRPEFWGGYRLRPSAIEFWQGRPNRLHDRLYYQLTSDRKWQRMRLAP